jgi:hypothetical protein
MAAKVGLNNCICLDEQNKTMLVAALIIYAGNLHEASLDSSSLLSPSDRNLFLIIEKRVRFLQQLIGDTPSCEGIKVTVAGSEYKPLSREEVLSKVYNRAVLERVNKK